MDTYWIGMLLLAAVFAAVPLLRRVQHARALRGLKLEGAVLRPRWGGLSGLDYPRQGWNAELRFESPPLGSDGRRGHLRLRGRLVKAAPPLRLPAGLGDAEAVVEGDAEFARRLLTPDLRERLARLQALGGRAESLGGEAVEISGPLPEGPQDLAAFLALSGEIVDRVVAATQ